jgi:hypothetical protein
LCCQSCVLAAALVGAATAASSKITFSTADKSMRLQYSGSCETTLDTCELATKSELAASAATLATKGELAALAARMTAIETIVNGNQANITAAAQHRFALDAQDVTIQNNIDQIQLTPGQKGATGAQGTHTDGAKGETGETGAKGETGAAGAAGGFAAGWAVGGFGQSCTTVCHAKNQVCNDDRMSAVRSAEALEDVKTATGFTDCQGNSGHDDPGDVTPFYIAGEYNHCEHLRYSGGTGYSRCDATPTSIIKRFCYCEPEALPESKWIVTDFQQSCNTACTARGGTCNAAMATAVRSQGALEAVLQETGFGMCETYGDDPGSVTPFFIFGAGYSQCEWFRENGQKDCDYVGGAANPASRSDSSYGYKQFCYCDV